MKKNAGKKYPSSTITSQFLCKNWSLISVLYSVHTVSCQQRFLFSMCPKVGKSMFRTPRPCFSALQSDCWQKWHTWEPFVESPLTSFWSRVAGKTTCLCKPTYRPIPLSSSWINLVADMIVISDITAYSPRLSLGIHVLPPIEMIVSFHFEPVQ